MSVRGTMRRVLLWLGVAAFFASTLYIAFVTGDLTGILGFAAFPVVGAVILSSRPRNGVGWLLYGIGLAWTLNGPLSVPGVPVDSPLWAQIVSVVTAWYGWGLIPLIGLYFPTGRIADRAGRVLAVLLVAYCSAAAVVTLIDLSVQKPLTGPAELAVAFVLGPGGIFFFVAIIVGIIANLALRWRRSDGPTRLQYRWLVFSLIVVVVIVGGSGLLNALLGNQPWVPIVTSFLVVSISLIPISIGIAITRHGLYEIGRVVSRTVAFAVVTLIAVGVYAGVVTSASLLIPQQNTVSVAVATLIAAALFLPLLRWVRRGVERRFDRERYNAQHVVEEFGGRLRSSVDPETTSPDLVAAVERTLQPRSVGVWTAGRVAISDNRVQLGGRTSPKRQQLEGAEPR